MACPSFFFLVVNTAHYWNVIYSHSECCLYELCFKGVFPPIKNNQGLIKSRCMKTMNADHSPQSHRITEQLQLIMWRNAIHVSCELTCSWTDLTDNNSMERIWMVLRKLWIYKAFYLAVCFLSFVLMVFCYTTHKWPKKVFVHCLTLQSFQRQSKWHMHINYISHFLGTNFTESSQPKSIQILVVFILNNIFDFFVKCLVWKVYLCCLSLHKWFLVCQCQTVPSTSWDRSIWLWCLWMYLQGKICWVFS